MKKNLFVVVLLCLSFVLIACGGGSASTTIDVTLTDFHFVPDAFTIPAGQVITVNAKNNGAVVHEFVIMKFGETAGDKFDNEDEGNIYWQVEVDPGGSKTETFNAPTEPGQYQIVCRTPGHLEAGMIGKLKVVDGK